MSRIPILKIEPSSCSLERLERLVPELCEDCAPSSEISLNLKKLSFARPAGIVPLTVKIVQLRQENAARVAQLVPPIDGKCAEYLSKIGFFDAVGAHYPDAFGRFFRRFRTVKSLPLTLLTDKEKYDKAAEDIAKMIVTLAGIAEENKESSLYTVISELFGNFFAHANTAVPAVFCAQAYPGQNGTGGAIEVAIADTGIGLRSSFDAGEKKNRIRPGTSICQMATTLGVTSKNVMHSGYGLWLVKELARTNGGSFKILSGGESLAVDGQNSGETIAKFKAHWQGTIVAFRLRLDGPIATKPLWDKVKDMLELEE
jgi:hypothetical protein